MTSRTRPAAAPPLAVAPAPVRADDLERFEEVFERHFAAVHRYVRGRLGPDAADDVAAEVFEIAFRRRRRYRAEHPSVLPWLLGIATNLVRRQRRAERAHLATLARGAALAGPPPGAPADPIDPALIAALAGLGVRDREVLLLAALGELERGELHRALGCSPEAARARLSRARRRIAGALAAADPIAPRSLR